MDSSFGDSKTYLETMKQVKLDRTYLSPTRRHNPQMLGLVYQSSLVPAAPVRIKQLFFYILKILSTLKLSH